jgi:DNA-binding MarR family transcriptional regulator
MMEVDLPGTLVYRLGTLGSVAASLFAARIAAYDLKPKHAGLLTALSRGAAASQQELAARLGVAPSLVVALADHLEALGAVERVRDPADRRRQVLSITDQGRKLLADCTSTARSLDDTLTQQLTPEQRQALHEALGILAAHHDLPT